MKYLYAILLMFLFVVANAQDDFNVTTKSLLEGTNTPGKINFNFNVDVNGIFEYTITPISTTTDFSCLSSGANTVFVDNQSESILVENNELNPGLCAGEYCFEVRKTNTITFESCVIEVCVVVKLCILRDKGPFVFWDCGSVPANDDLAFLISNQNEVYRPTENRDLTKPVDRQTPNIDLIIVKERNIHTSFWVGEIYPNPFDRQTIVPLSIAKRSNIYITCFDLYGRLLFEQQLDLEQGEHLLPINLENITYSGSLYLKISDNTSGNSRYRKLLKI